jgi:hypothetical protein
MSDKTIIVSEGGIALLEKEFEIGVKDYKRKGRVKTFRIEKITKCFIYWIELNTNNWNNNHKVSRTKKRFCDVLNCEYFKDNGYGYIYADGTYH